MKTIFVAFCGGCKPEIDRKGLLQKVQSLLPDYAFHYSVEEDDRFCFCLILNGCPTECRTKEFRWYPNCISVRGEMIGDKVVKEELLPQEVVATIQCPANTTCEILGTDLALTKGKAIMKEIRIHGRGGQGGVTAAGIIGSAAVADGRYAQAFPAFGTERRGAPVLAFCKISDTYIRNRSQVYNPDIVIVLDEGLLSMVDVSAGMKADGIIIINSNKSPEALPLQNSREGGNRRRYQYLPERAGTADREHHHPGDAVCAPRESYDSTP